MVYFLIRGLVVFFSSPVGRLMGVLVPTVGGIKMNENLCHVDNGM